MNRVRCALLFGFLGLSCSSSTTTTPYNQPSASTLYSSQVTSVTVEIDYGTGAAPYTGTVDGFEIWTTFLTNAQRIFQNTKGEKSVIVPTSLSEMQELTDITSSKFTTNAILSIADTHRDTLNTGNAASFYVVFLPGYYVDDTGKENDQVLGVSIGNTGVIAMFKPVVEAAAVGSSAAKLVEQSTLVHEFGHAVGLVNNPVPLVAQHLDTPHGAHCTNQNCVMYYMNEGSTSGRAFAARVKTGKEVLFDDDCLADIDAFAAQQK